MSHRKRPHISTRSVYQWHRYIGINAALFVLLLSITGLMLNHTETLSLNKEYIQNNWLLDHYGIVAPEKVQSYAVTKHWISKWDNHLFFDQINLGIQNGALVGAIEFQDMFVLALEDSILLITNEGELVEKLTGNEGIPAAISAIGITDKQKVAVMASHGIYTADDALIIWQDDKQAITIWADSKELPAPLYQNILEQYRGKGLSLERVVLDLHSGRLFNQGGVYFMDMIALLLIFLACSGLWLWGIRWWRNTQRNKPMKNN
jgi:hypothetical protein